MNRNLIVFAREPLLGRVKTRIARRCGAQFALGLYEALLSDLTRRIVSPFHGRRFLWIDGQARSPGFSWDFGPVYRQAGADLGERLNRAFCRTFEADPGPSVVIGVDCPALDGEKLSNLFMALENGYDAAVIPATDGGFVALGLARWFDGVFDGIPWSTSQTFAQTLANLKAVGLRIKVENPLPDVDEDSDFPAFLECASRNPSLATDLARIGLYRDRPVPVVDDLGRLVPLNPAPERILSLVPSVTEALYDLGIGGKIIGRTDFCISPPTLVQGVETVGGPKSLDVPSILALKPDLAFADAEENDREQVEALFEAGLRVFVALPRTLLDVEAFLRRAGRLCRDTERAEGGARALGEFAKPAGLPVPAVCLVWKDPLIAASKDTLPGALMEAAGYENLVKTCEGARYPRLGEACLAGLKPRVLLLPSEPYAFSREEAGALSMRCGIAETLLFPGEWITWYGMRTADNLRKLAALRPLPNPPECGGIGKSVF